MLFERLISKKDLINFSISPRISFLSANSNNFKDEASGYYSGLMDEKTMSEIYQYLENNQIEYDRHDHVAVYTCEEADQHVPKLPAAKTKNLFMRDAKGKNHFLVVTQNDSSVDIKQLASVIGSSKLSMGSPERLLKHLGITPGAVSLLALINDSEHNVQVVIDEKLWNANALSCHPCVNTATLVISHGDIEKFLTSTGHQPKIVAIPLRNK